MAYEAPTRATLWNADVWSAMDSGVTEEVFALRIAQQLFHSAPVDEGNTISVDVFDAPSMTIAESEQKPYLEISVSFPLTHGQADDESRLGTGQTLARQAGKLIALTEDLLFFQGGAVTLPDAVQVSNLNTAGDGLLGLDIETVAVPLVDSGEPGVYGGNTFKAVTQGIAKLVKAGQPGAFGLILETSVYADTWAPIPSAPLTNTADRIVPLVPGGFFSTGTLPEKTGLLVSLGGRPTTVYVRQDPITETQPPGNGNLNFRVWEKVRLVARDPRSLVKLTFE